MKLPISKRLLACSRFISPGQLVADVGTDHGYLPIYLLREKGAAWVYAGDIGEKPLQKARDNAARFGVTDRISFYCCSGVEGLPRDFDVLVMAGMGAETMVSILRAAPWLRDDRYRLVLQCQSSQNELRLYLSENGWTIRREEPVRDGHFLYTVMEALRGDAPLTPGQHFVPPALRGSSMAEEYRQFCIRTVENVACALRDQGGEKYEYYSTALKELEEMGDRSCV